VNSLLSRIAVVVLVALLPFPAAPSAAGEIKLVDQGGGDPRLKGFFAPEGVKIEIAAASPVILASAGMTFGDDGTAYVLEKRNAAGDQKTKAKDVVKVLLDTHGKGVYDASRVLLEVEPSSSLLYHDGWLYLGGDSVRRLRLGQMETHRKEEILAKGFGGASTQRVVGLSLGNDGWLYISAVTGDHRVEGSDGSHALTLRSGAVFRCRPDGSRLHLFAFGCQHPQGGLSFNALGSAFLADADASGGDKVRSCRLLHVAEGCDFGWRQRWGEANSQADSFRTAMNGELPGKIPPILRTSRSDSTGTMIYNDTRFPERFRGLLYLADADRHCIKAYRLESKGASFRANEELVLLKSDEVRFRPRQLISGPDGAIYILNGEGQIYRLSWAGTKTEPALPPVAMDSWLRIVRQSDDQLLASLTSPEASSRLMAQRELTRRGERNRSELLRLLQDGDQPLRARVAALCVLESIWNKEVEGVFLSVLANGEPPLRHLTANVLGRSAAHGDKRVHEALFKVLNDNDVALRRAAALAMGRLGSPGAIDALVNTLAFDESGDLYLRDGLIRAIERLGKPGVVGLLGLAESGVKKDTDRVVEVFAALRTRAGFEALPTLLKYPHLTVLQRVKLIRSCGNYLLDPPIALDTIKAYLATPAGQAEEIKQVGADLLAAFPNSASPKTPKP
jgi:quinoprotein glucose dehydrogenase